MGKYKFIPVSIYKREIGVFIGSRTEFRNWVEKEYKNDEDYRGLVDLIQDSGVRTEAASFWYNESTGDGIIELPKFPKTPREIAECTHEALHATFQILDFVGVSYEKDGSNESFTYLLEHIVNNILTIGTYKVF